MTAAPLSLLAIASVCHEANRTYVRARGGGLGLAWGDTSSELRDSIVAGVRTALEDPAATPESMHAAWLRYKTDQGWVRGPLIDVKKHEHPNLVPWGDLPEAEQRKDRLFLAVVRALT